MASKFEVILKQALEKIAAPPHEHSTFLYPIDIAKEALKRINCEHRRVKVDGKTGVASCRECDATPTELMYSMQMQIYDLEVKIKDMISISDNYR